MLPRSTQAKRDYLVPDLLAPDLRLVLCGTAPSRASAQRRAYYAKPGNRFWPTLHRVGLTPRLLAPEEYPQLLSWGIGLTDLCKVHSGVDAELPPDAFDIAAFERKLKRYRPRCVAFTSKNAAAASLGFQPQYGWQESVGTTRIYVLCSPSGLATRFFDVSVWQQLAREIEG
ncbi:MAG: mismatch-specific DNA-glycosylase [Burkholderiales bacterium]